MIWFDESSVCCLSLGFCEALGPNLGSPGVFPSHKVTGAFDVGSCCLADADHADDADVSSVGLE